MSPFLSDCPSLILGIAINCIQHSQAMLERGICELAHSFFHLLLEIWLFSLPELNTRVIFSYLLLSVYLGNSSHFLLVLHKQLNLAHFH